MLDALFSQAINHYETGLDALAQEDFDRLAESMAAREAVLNEVREVTGADPNAAERVQPELAQRLHEAEANFMRSLTQKFDETRSALVEQRRGKASVQRYVGA